MVKRRCLLRALFTQLYLSSLYCWRIRHKTELSRPRNLNSLVNKKGLGSSYKMTCCAKQFSSAALLVEFLSNVLLDSIIIAGQGTKVGQSYCFNLLYAKRERVTGCARDPTVQAYFDAFSLLIGDKDRDERYLIDLFISGLRPGIKEKVHWFRPRSLSDACVSAGLQESTNNALKKMVEERDKLFGKCSRGFVKMDGVAGNMGMYQNLKKDEEIIDALVQMEESDCAEIIIDVSDAVVSEQNLNGSEIIVTDFGDARVSGQSSNSAANDEGEKLDAAKNVEETDYDRAINELLEADVGISEINMITRVGWPNSHCEESDEDVHNGVVNCEEDGKGHELCEDIVDGSSGIEEDSDGVMVLDDNGKETESRVSEMDDEYVEVNSNFVSKDDQVKDNKKQRSLSILVSLGEICEGSEMNKSKDDCVGSSFVEVTTTIVEKTLACAKRIQENKGDVIFENQDKMDESEVKKDMKRRDLSKWISRGDGMNAIFSKNGNSDGVVGDVDESLVGANGKERELLFRSNVKSLLDEHELDISEVEKISGMAGSDILLENKSSSWLPLNQIDNKSNKLSVKGDFKKCVHDVQMHTSEHNMVRMGKSFEFVSILQDSLRKCYNTPLFELQYICWLSRSFEFGDEKLYQQRKWIEDLQKETKGFINVVSQARIRLAVLSRNTVTCGLELDMQFDALKRKLSHLDVKSVIGQLKNGGHGHVQFDMWRWPKRKKERRKESYVKLMFWYEDFYNEFGSYVKLMFWYEDFYQEFVLDCRRKRAVVLLFKFDARGRPKKKLSRINYKFRSRFRKFYRWKWRTRKKIRGAKSEFKYKNWHFDIWRWPLRKREGRTDVEEYLDQIERMRWVLRGVWVYLDQIEGMRWVLGGVWVSASFASMI
nr:hypothetical protein [Tanacetum cinerariifolium]